MATHSSNLAWEIPWTEEPGGLQSMGSPRIGHDFATKHAHTMGKKTQNNTKRLDKIVYSASFNCNCLKMACMHTHTHVFFNL